jgi:hypothetical protein
MRGDFDYGRKRPHKARGEAREPKRPNVQPARRSRDWVPPAPQKRPSAESRELAGEYTARILESLRAMESGRSDSLAPLPACDEDWWRAKSGEAATAIRSRLAMDGAAKGRGIASVRRILRGTTWDQG